LPCGTMQAPVTQFVRTLNDSYQPKFAAGPLRLVRDQKESA